MATPNIVNVATINGKTTYVSLTTTSSTLLLGSVSTGHVYKVNSIIVSNTDGTNAVNFSLNYNTGAAGGGTDVQMISTVSVPANASLIALDKSTSIYIDETNSLTAIAGTASKLKVIISYEDIS
jgi:hypothetical protein